MENKRRVHAVISGRVQGVFFRMETKYAAERFGVFGWVRNLPDGTVEAVFEGDEKNVADVLAWCEQGPPHARVDKVVSNQEPVQNKFDRFDVVY
ncbi:MAG: acylphosphatase [Desulfobacterales bacterium]|nr:acylphosphatase [Desulfobacterales bacterium]